MKPIRRVAVLGLGTMGHGIVQAFAAAGFQVSGYDERKEARKALHKVIKGNLKDLVATGLMRKASVAPLLARIRVCDTEAEAVHGAQFVTEAVLEDLPVKQELFARLEGLVAEDTILASNSSTFPISQSAAKMKRPQRAIVTHWFNPAHLVPVVEVVPGKRTSRQVTEVTMTLMKRLRKEAVRIDREVAGFIVNRVQVAVWREVWSLLDQGVASPEAIDAAVRGSIGLRLAAIGPLEVNDFGGLDLHTRVFQNLAGEIYSGTKVPSKIRRLVEAGHFGVKTGKGIYDYTPASLTAKRSRRDQRILALLKMFYSRNGAAHSKRKPDGL